MSEAAIPPFRKFLEAGVEKGGFETDDVLAALLPLMKQVRAVHEQGLVAPLDGLGALILPEPGQLMFSADQASPPRKNAHAIEQLQRPASRGVEVVGESRLTTDLSDGSLQRTDLEIGTGSEPVTRPTFLPGYRSWEQVLGHHDELTDIFSLGMLLGSVACGLDFTEPGELEQFAANRTNLFTLHRRLNPIVASVIVQMTELNRHKRAPDLGETISRLENYREQRGDVNYEGLHGFKEEGLTGKRRLIQSHLRDRLFEISRRNRLIYFRPTLQTLNLTVASVPVLLDYRNIKLEQLFVWHPDLARTITEGAPMSLGKYLRFEDAPYIPGVLDKIISEARRDRAEYGFAQLRLVLCFLHWNNLKEAPEERIHSPLLLLPVELTKKKGVRDSYVLDPTTSEAEINPALRHYLKELYNLNLPEGIDLKEVTLDQFHESLRAQIHASEPGVMLNKVDRPRIELIHEKAQQRIDQYRRRIKLQERKVRRATIPDYSYEREGFRPLGLQLFLEKVRPSPLPLRELMGAAPRVRLPHVVEPESPAPSSTQLEVERKAFALRDGQNENPYSWDFDWCSLTLGNFNYRKMTLVRDYAKLIETDMASGAFDTVFSLSPKAPETSLPPLELKDQHLVISCDATQASAIARARTGASYIIQGPPGTGKSQTITNLIADYVAQGKRVLFVCEKRAAIDVVFHRLRRQGLDELCCLIHDSQTDKKAFIQNLKQTYEKFLNQEEIDAGADQARAAALRAIEQDLAVLKQFSEAMQQPHARTGVGVRSLLHRLVELRGSAREIGPAMEELLPEYPLWLRHGELIERLSSALQEMGEERCFAKHPLRWLGKGVLQADRPVETLARYLDQAEELLDAIENALELSGLSSELWDTFEEIEAILEFAVRAGPLAERNLLALLRSGSAVNAFDKRSAQLDSLANVLAQARHQCGGWKDPLSPDDTQSALAQTQAFEHSLFRWLQPAFWRLKKTLQARYDFTQHAVAPSWSKVLKDLAAQHEAQATLNQLSRQACEDWRCEDSQAFRALVSELRVDPLLRHTSVGGLMDSLAAVQEPGTLMQNLAAIHPRFNDLRQALAALLAKHGQLDFPELTQILAVLRDQSGTLAELSPLLGELAELPEPLADALRRVEIPLDQFEGAIGHKSLNVVYRQDRAMNRFEGRLLERKMSQIDKHYRQWLAVNARCLRLAVRQRFLEHVRVSSLPASQLTPEEKTFKKTYAAGRRDLEHEFGKTMRFKSIRDLAAGDTGRVIQDLKPIWLMSPLSVSDTLPLDPELFDVVIFDEASQIPLEEAIPAIYRSHQVIIVGDEMQLPPTTFFATSRGDDETVVIQEEGERIEVDLDSDSFLTQSGQNLASTLLAWHYRSQSEALISFSNAAFYAGNLFTVPDRHCIVDRHAEIRVTAPEQGEENAAALLARSISYHFLEIGVYEERTNPNEAAYIAHLIRALLAREAKLSIGVVAFSEAQQSEIESALDRLGEADREFAGRLEAEYVREENDVFCGLFVKNLENVQGDERDIIIMSVCYGRDPSGRMLMNFGPINQRGGEKRLNVIFSRAKQHMAMISSIHHQDITNEYNDGAHSLKNFLHYAEATSQGDIVTARRVLENLNPLSRKALAPLTQDDAVVAGLAEALRGRGYVVELNVGQSKFRCDLAIRAETENSYRLGILVDTDGHYANPNLLDRYFMQPSILRTFGWRVLLVLTKDWYHHPDDVLKRIEKVLQGEGAVEPADGADDDAPPALEPAASRPVDLPEAPADSSRPVASPKQQRRRGLANQPPAAPSSPREGPIRRFELTSGSSNKFWTISLSGKTFTVRFGRIGTPGQSQTKELPDATQAQRVAESLIAEKLKKGYVETV